MTGQGSLVIERLRELPGGPELLDVARERGGVELVGGAVRDILLGRVPRELDTLVRSDVQAVVDALVERLDGEATVHERFGTALISSPVAQIDLVRARVESYPAPGALPEVRAGTLDEDLARRDFTVNAIAVALDGARAGEMRSAANALEDLQARRLRVLHERSFIDDPTRLLRLARYVARLGFEIEPGTRELVARAIETGALATVSGGRIGAELRLALAEVEPVAAIEKMSRLGLLSALHTGLRFDGEEVEQALVLLPADGRPDLLVLASLARDLVERSGDSPGGPAYALLSDWQFPAQDRDRALAAAAASGPLSRELSRTPAPSRVRALARRTPLEGVALAGARGGPDCARAAVEWLTRTRHVGLAITGEDLLKAGVPHGPEIGLRLNAALALLLDGKLDGTPETQLQAALRAEM
jgi:tRNA nucleotidyltransferase (CCA-adding enzyme)